ncbi:hypothetical protein WISP_49130 [Willisornis vidua]|uniref:Cytochrome c oxidase assembly protein COX16 homolog, mitochondrial n=1 Tax=Willisornis vidua TaxID=1566151 RepID=A0ABQ9DK96_9PASS|nr:hypothetical protein WISP_49130 [Willisornis vidua]
MGMGMERLRKLWRGRTVTFGLPLLLYLIGGSFGLREFAQIRYDVHNLHGKVDPALKEKLKLKQNTVTLESEYELYVLNAMPYDLGCSCGQLGTAVPAVSPPVTPGALADAKAVATVEQKVSKLLNSTAAEFQGSSIHLDEQFSVKNLQNQNAENNLAVTVILQGLEDGSSYPKKVEMDSFMLRVWGLPEGSQATSPASGHQWKELGWAEQQHGPAATVLPLELLRQDVVLPLSPKCSDLISPVWTLVETKQYPYPICANLAQASLPFCTG